MSDVVVFDGFDAWEFYQQCVARMGDREYCKKMAKLLIEVETERSYVYGEKVRLRAVLPQHIKHFAVTTDKERRYVMIFLDFAIRVPGGEPRPAAAGGRYVAMLLYERRGDGFRLKTIDWMTPETRAMKNPHPSTFFRHQ
jgi:hypothetical protein